MLRIVDDAARKRDNVEMNASRSYPTRSTIGQPRVPGRGRQEARPDRRRAARAPGDSLTLQNFSTMTSSSLCSSSSSMSSSPDGRASTKSSTCTRVRQDRRAPGEGALLEALVPDYNVPQARTSRVCAVHVHLDVRVSCLFMKSSKYPYGMVVRFGRPCVPCRVCPGSPRCLFTGSCHEPRPLHMPLHRSPFSRGGRADCRIRVARRSA